MFGIAQDKKLMGEYIATKRMSIIYLMIIGVVSAAIFGMLWFSIN
jgi:hypothetical protein